MTNQKVRPTIVIEAKAPPGHYLRELLRFHELLQLLAWRDILVRYKQTVVGIAWSVIRPLLMMLILVFVFGRVANLDGKGVPYPVLVFAALLPWQFFANALTDSSASLINNANLIGKIYFPRMILPLSAMAVAIVDFAISFLILLGIMAFCQYAPTWRMLALPLLMI
ncbi:MAG: ABC transporter permease, partial [Verrucomicrobiota bacterium]